MKSKKKDSVEEISVNEIEVLDSKGQNSETITRISADDLRGIGGGENPFGKMMEMMEEWKKVRFFGPVAFLLSLIGVTVQTLYLAPLAILLALLDIWKGSKLTKKLSIFAIIIAVLSLLNSWT